jgi:hypothetical protein
MKVLVCGSRSMAGEADKARVFAVLDLIHRGATVQEIETLCGIVAGCQWEDAGLAGKAGIHVLIHGACGVDKGRLGKSEAQDRAEWRKLKGADGLASEWHRARSVSTSYGPNPGSIRLHLYPADWTHHGIGAGPRRNQEMLQREHLDVEHRPEGPLDLVLAFPSLGPGTHDMTQRARKARVPVLEVPA